MSEEILKALMQLFAIIAKQDGVLIENHEKYVTDFLNSQLSLERVNEYVELYRGFLNDGKQDSGGDKARTSMKDSVRTLSICKKINKTLAQKQKIIVLIRLIEFFKNDAQYSANRQQIVETVADVFNVEKTEFSEIRDFVFEREVDTTKNEILIGDDQHKNEYEYKHFIGFHHYHGLCKLILIKSINVVILKSHGKSELFLNGLLIKPEAVYLFPQGSTLRLPQGTLYYSNIITRFTDDATLENFSFDAHIIEHKFPNGKKALNELVIAENSGAMVGIMGASGSGKTTLLTLLSGQDKPTTGDIKINGVSIYAGDSGLKGVMGYVPQDDLLIEDLSVFQNLYYNAKLCFRDLTEEEVLARIDKTLAALGLEEIKNIKVGSPLNKKISGGQRKRLNIALELIREPLILFLDEPTSGLSSRDSENVMDLLKELTFKGKLIFVVIHQPSSDIFKMFDKMLILDTGGFGTFYGNPVEGVMYFKQVTNQVNSEVGECYACGSVNPETIFNLLELKEINEYGNYTEKRKVTPAKYYEMYKEKFTSKQYFKEINEKIRNTFSVPNAFVQTKYFFLRDLFSKLSNKQYILINLLEVPALVTFLSLIIRYTETSKNSGYTYFHNYNIPAYFFMSIIAALLVGLTISAEEIYKDQKILKREKFLHLSRMSYLSSKVILLFSISIIQSVLYVLIGNLILEIRINYFHFFLMLFSVFAFANILGLVLSSTFNSPVTIYIIIPLVIIPQMLLGGAMFNYNKLNKWFGGGNNVPMAANFMVSRWAYEGLAVDMHTNNVFEKKRYKYDKLESKLNYKLTYFIPKLEELINTGDSADNFSKNAYNSLVKYELQKDIKHAKNLGFPGMLPAFDSKSKLKTYLKDLSAFYNMKFVDATNLKEKLISDEIKKNGGKEKYDYCRVKYFNNRLDEICTSSYEKDKIVIENDRLEQVIDPIYRDPETENNHMGLGTHFLSPVKQVFGTFVSTFNYNVSVIWILNIILFVLLYFDVFKRLMNRFN